MPEKNNNEELRPTKMRGVAFPKAKYGVILAVIIIIVVNLRYYQCIQSRYGFNPHHAQLADGIEVFIGQGQKVGMGGHLMGQKVTDQVAI